MLTLTLTLTVIDVFMLSSMQYVIPHVVAEEIGVSLGKTCWTLQT
jgi:hypothetical protein